MAFNDDDWVEFDGALNCVLIGIALVLVVIVIGVIFF
jgi:hypothetical protein